MGNDCRKKKKRVKIIEAVYARAPILRATGGSPTSLNNIPFLTLERAALLTTFFRPH